jgi:large subunit ribosomal protein L3
MGGGRRTVQNLSVVKVLSDKNLILLRGSVPGAEGSELILRAAKKARKTA